ncbi:hypothetical protein KFK09_002344 [Dendrobium nobile]|uniref:Uncharacterized protein n=1 Tax=Dendrobium nobile TaxID=94219 RepID=A0A8T3C6Z5_DENNO|nr:hypothetical protein KFK09_002344 [Dendrobium nobile]
MEGTSCIRKVASRCSMADEDDDVDLARLLDKPKLNIERQRSFDERSFSELSINIRAIDGFESLYSPGGIRSGLNTPAWSARNSFETHPTIAEAWEALRLVGIFPWPAGGNNRCCGSCL